MTGVSVGALAALTVWAAMAAGDAWRAAPARARAACLRCPAVGTATDQGWLARKLVDAGVPGSSVRWASGGAAAVAAACLLALAVGGPVLALLALAGGLGAPWLALTARRGRGSAVVEAALPPLLESTARGLRAGASLPTALAAAASAAAPTLAGDLAQVAADAPAAGLVAALDRWAAQRPLPGVRLAAAALAMAVEVGGGGARALDGVALTLRQRQAVAGEVRALATQARLSAVVLTLAPLAFAVLAAASDPRTAEVLLRSPIGQLCLGLGLVLDAFGAAWMARITRAGST